MLKSFSCLRILFIFAQWMFLGHPGHLYLFTHQGGGPARRTLAWCAPLSLLRVGVNPLCPRTKRKPVPPPDCQGGPDTTAPGADHKGSPQPVGPGCPNPDTCSPHKDTPGKNPEAQEEEN